MKRLKKYFLPIAFFFSSYVFAQNENSKWYFGSYAALDFMTNPPTIINNSAMVARAGCSSIADGAGNLLFYTNGDNLNESFKPVMHGQTQYRFQVFNRWGTKVFETQDPQSGWDGNFKGEPCQEDVYVWKIIASNSKQEKTLNGTVKVVR